MPKAPLPPLAKIHDPGNRYEIGVDEAGRGPLFGRLYVAACALPKDDHFHHEWMRDSKKIHSRKKMQEISAYIKSAALAWHIQYVDADVIDTINIRQAVLSAMHECAKQVMAKLTAHATSKPDDASYLRDYMLLVDGNDFTPHLTFCEETQALVETPSKPSKGEIIHIRASLLQVY